MRRRRRRRRKRRMRIGGEGGEEEEEKEGEGGEEEGEEEEEDDDDDLICRSVYPITRASVNVLHIFVFSFLRVGLRYCFEISTVWKINSGSLSLPRD